MRGSGGALAAVVIGLLAFVLLCSTSALEEGEEGTHILLPTQGEEGDEEEGKKPWECCDLCVCTRSIPPWCQCRDQRVGSCHPGCKRCAYTRSEPPQCRCDDIIQDYCGDPCAAAVGLDKTTK